MKNPDKIQKIEGFVSENEIKKVFILSPKKFFIEFKSDIAETIEYSDIIQYKYFYRLLQEIDQRSLVVVNECLRTKNRNDLTYNCIRHFLNQAGHVLVFQRFPIIENRDDFMTLFDFDTHSQWKRVAFDPELFKHSKIEFSNIAIKLNRIDIIVPEKTQVKYAREKKIFFDNIGIRDPHTIPRNLYLIGGPDKFSTIQSNSNQNTQIELFSAETGMKYLSRNNRFNSNNFEKYKQDSYSGKYTIFEFCHNHIDFVDFLSLSEQTQLDVLVASLKVDEWYWNRYTDWVKELDYVYSAIRQ